MSRTEFDVILVGNGAIACALALQLSAKNLDMQIAIVGPAQRPGCASLAAGAMLNAFAELEAGALDHPMARRKFEAAARAAKMWDAHLALLNSRLQAVPPVTINQGTYVVSNAAADALDDENFEGIIGYLKEFKEPFREVSPREIKGIKPMPQSRPLRAIFIENEGTVSSKHLHRAYDEAFSRTPCITVIDAEVEAIEPGGSTRQVRTKTGETLSARHVVVAAGVFTQKLVNQLGLERRIPRIVLGIGVSLILKSQTAVPEKVFRTPNRGLACGVYVVPYGDNYCYVGATNFICPWEVPLPRVQAVHTLLTAAMEQVSSDLFNAEIHKTIVGYRPTTMDTFPLFGRTSIDGVWIASGTKRDGFHLSPLIATELMTGIETGAQPFSGAFRPERPLILEVPKQAAIDRSVRHLISGGYQHGFRLPHSNWEPLIESAVRSKVLEAYERCGLADREYGIPPELLDMYRYGHAKLNIETLLAGEH